MPRTAVPRESSPGCTKPPRSRGPTWARLRALKFRDDVMLQDRIATGDQSLARILIGGKAVVTVRERSVVTPAPAASTRIVPSSALQPSGEDKGKGGGRRGGRD